MEENFIPEKKKGRKGLIVTIIILILLLIGALGYIAYDKGYLDKLLGKEEPVKEEVKEEKLSKEEIEELDDDLMIRDADLFFKKDTTIENVTNEELLPYIFAKYLDDKDIDPDKIKKISVCDENAEYSNSDDYIDSSKKLYLCTYDSNNEMIHANKSDAVAVSRDEVQKIIKEVFNVDKNLTIKNNTSYAGNQVTPSFIYFKDDDKFYLVNAFVGDLGVYNAESNMIKYEQEKGMVVIYNKVAKCMGTSCSKTGECIEGATVSARSGGSAVNCGSDSAKVDSKIIKDNQGEKLEIDFDYVFNNYGDIFNTYKTTFKKGNDGKYYWYSSEIVK